jgi:hypothetical protein
MPALRASDSFCLSIPDLTVGAIQMRAFGAKSTLLLWWWPAECWGSAGMVVSRYRRGMAENQLFAVWAGNMRY